MEQVRLGNTGLKVSRICLGTMTYGSPKWRDWVLDEQASRPFIKRALEAGITFFDTADIYSNGASEEVVGRALRDILSSPIMINNDRILSSLTSSTILTLVVVPVVYSIIDDISAKFSRKKKEV